MVRAGGKRISRKETVKGGGIIDSIIDKLPFELHIPGGYQFCGPGTNLDKRLKRGDAGKNQLDQLCKIHDLAYSDSLKNKATYKEVRRLADLKLEEAAWNRVKAADSSFGEKAAAWLVTNGMKIKRKLSGGGMKRKTKKKTKIIKGGILPLLLAGLTTLGSLVGGLGTAGKAISTANTNAKRLEEEKRHNMAMESKGRGLYLKPYKIKGSGQKAKKKNVRNKRN